MRSSSELWGLRRRAPGRLRFDGRCGGQPGQASGGDSWHHGVVIYAEEICQQAGLPVGPGWEECRDSSSLLAAAVLLSWSPPAAAQSTFDLKEWPVEWGGRTRDPAIAPDGKVWFVGQAGNYIANLDPASGAQKKYGSRRAPTPTRSSSTRRAPSGTRATATAVSDGSIRPPAPSR